ncbi:hypothetical protein ACIP79_36150 [Streptomyces sp. NPDC088747]|uniref:hypothetical protein n=1 Tax=Streptomyces sp. NPDC088747 TaxID=3365886 RepID=UPI00380F4F7E
MAPLLAPPLPLPIPEILATGVPGAGYPWPWSVLRRLEGELPVPGGLTDAGGCAADLPTSGDSSPLREGPTRPRDRPPTGAGRHRPRTPST